MDKKYFLKLVLSTIFFLYNGWSQNSALYIKVRNPANVDRRNETVSVKWETLLKKAPWLDSAKVIITDETKEGQLVTQILDGEFLFQSGFKPNETKLFVLSNSSLTKGTPPSVVDAKFVIPRKDVAWENDRIAFRIYGGPLAGDVFNGLDVWVKRVRYNIIDKWYDGDSLKGKRRISYHVDHGEGADFFNVGKSLGAGGSALWKDGHLYQPGLFIDHKITAAGPIRSKFTVWYEFENDDKKIIREEKTYTLDAGENLNRIEISYSGIQKKGSVGVAVGLVKRINTKICADEKRSWLSLWGLTNEDTTNGFLGTGIVMLRHDFKKIVEDSIHFLMIGSTNTDKKITYYAGAGWTRSGDFNSVEDWNNYLHNFTVRLTKPLKVTFTTKK
jgi:pectinesterase